jgi:hypothetical protein
MYGLLLFLTPHLTACHIIPEQQTQANLPASISAIVQQPRHFAGRSVILDASFTGWKGSCRGPVPATRSDWMIEDGEACLYVTGPLPVGFSAAAPEHGIGAKISVSGKIELTSDGRAFLRLSQ